MNNNKIFLCAISNVSSGNCSEDCGFCTQSAYFSTGIDTYKYKDINQVLKEAHIAKNNGAIGFCLVTSGKGLNGKKIEYVSKLAHTIKKEIQDMYLIGCNGIASLEQLKELKKAGIDSYNHNLETSKEFYPHVCKTHSWDERFQTCANAKDADLMLCSGGIFGLGESENDRESFIKSLQELSPMSIPINFYHPNDNVSIKTEKLTQDEALRLIQKVRSSLPEPMLMIAGGREITIGENLQEAFKMGANSIVIGDYLTTQGNRVKKDLDKIKDIGYKVADFKDCIGA